MFNSPKVLIDGQNLVLISHTAQKMKFFIKDFFSKCEQIGRKLRIWSHLLNCAVSFCLRKKEIDPILEIRGGP